MTNNEFDMSGITVLVTGATGYLGKEISLGLAASGANVLINSRSQKRANALVDELLSLGFKAEPAVFDVSNTVQVFNFFEHYNGSLSVIINNAYYGSGGTIEHSTATDFKLAYEVTVESANTLFQRALPLLRQSVQKHGYASVVSIASMYGKVTPDLRIYATAEGCNPPFYGAAKAALIQWSKYGACEFGKEGIRFNTISPGPFPNLEHNNSEFIEVLSSKVPMGRVGKADEMKGPVVFLASKASSFVNGSDIAVDGGWTTW